MLGRIIVFVLAFLVLATPVFPQQRTALTHAQVNVTTSSTAVASAVGGLLIIVNDSDTVIYCNLAGAAAVVNRGVRLNAEGGTMLLDVVIPANNVACIHGGSGNKSVIVTQGK